MKDLTKDATDALERATAQVTDTTDYVGYQDRTYAVELQVRLAAAHAQMAIARQAEITNLLQVRRDFAEFSDVSEKVNERLRFLLGL